MPVPAPFYSMVFVVFWYQLDADELPFPANRAISSLPSGNGALLGFNAYYDDPRFAGIYITSNGLSGGNQRWIITFTEYMIDRRIKAYVNFANVWYVYDLQIWGPGTWTIHNPGTGPAIPNQIIFGDPVDISEDFNPGEQSPNHPPPTYNPFRPRVIEEFHNTLCTEVDSVSVLLIPPANVSIIQVFISKDGVPYHVPLEDLLAGYTFTEYGQYNMVIHYSFMGHPTETLTAYFLIMRDPYTYVQVERTFSGFILRQSTVVFDHTLISNGSIENNTVNGELEIHFCGIFFVKWFVAPQFGLTTDGVNFAIVSGGAQGPQGSGHSSVSPAVGYAVIEVNSVPHTFRLVNTSDEEFALSGFTQVSAGLVIAKIGDVDTVE